ncbi:hypothetical protein OIU76_026265 [Salix suchowensis]|uniref:RING-type E3 ubiquitin transferase n=1 Tax=Salix suchowensis TaxID=1278906 RepID=A0ABQ9AF49_9ROSI|nr:E3 ubiquitin-protein ligase [Salix suchowensis]KAJ6333439.1 hypothetical protein OIU77_009333 [Salix suchowensis]KAJ6377259.1 hypothetical protein OIU76_026265 [Salix suchowensis]
MGSEDDRRASINQKIMVAMLLCSFGFVLLLVLLHLYSRHLLRAQQRRRRAILFRDLGRQTVPDIENYIEPPKRGLDPLVISSLPVFTYKLAEQTDHGEPVDECSICLGTIVEGDSVRVLPNCKHTFHVECIDIWLGSHSTCPICRTDAEPKIQPAGETAMDSGAEPSAPPLEENMVHGSDRMEREGGSDSRLPSFSRDSKLER